MSLIELDNNIGTNKNTTHSYLELYENLLFKKKYTSKNVLEVGGFSNNGSGLLLWHDYFTNATIYSIEILPIEMMRQDLLNKERIVFYSRVDAYNEDFFTTNFLDKNIKFDFILEQGYRILDTMKQFIKLYSQVMTDDGILIIEDIPDITWIEELTASTPDHLKEFIHLYDLRPNKNRFDDIVFTIDKSNPN